MTLTMIALIFASNSTATTTDFNNNSITHFIRYVQGGVELITSYSAPFEICVEKFCETFRHPRNQEIVIFSAAIVLQEKEIQWKLLHGSSIKTIETVCPPAPFCESIDCSFCAAVVFNPECWPMGAIAVSAIIIYFVMTGCYVFLYVPLVIPLPLPLCTTGRPFRLVSSCVAFLLRGIVSRMR